MKSEYEIKVTGTSGNWTFGTICKPGGETFVFQAKHYEEPSQFGIDVGRVSKLCVRRDGETKDVIVYERGWLVKPHTEYPPLVGGSRGARTHPKRKRGRAHRAVLAALKEKFN